MSQYGTNVPGSPGNSKTADVTNGSATVTLNDVDATSYIDAGDLFNAASDIVSYEISSVSYSSPDTTVTLVESYQGSTDTGVDFLVNRAFTTNRGYALPEQGDVRGLLAVRRALIDIDSDFAGFNPRGDYDNTATYNKLDLVTGADGNAYVAEVDGLTGDAPPSSNWTQLLSGITWRTGSGAPSDSLGENGDFYLDTDSGDLYRKDSGTYSVEVNIEGPTGPQGEKGDEWHSGSGAPSSGLGDDGDFYLDTASGDVYEKAAGSWSVIDNLTGPTGPQGDSTRWIDGSGAPGSGTGDDGDFYLDNDTGDVYEKASGSWSQIANIEGPQGPAGDDGAVWRDGSGAPSDSLGVNGDYYLDNDTGDVYEKSGGTYSVQTNIKGPSGSGAATVVDLGDNGTDDTTDLSEVAITNDTNSAFTVPSSNKLLIDLSKNWPTADDVPDAAVDHDLTTNFVANEHIDHSGVNITAGTGLSGGGDITATRTLNVDIGGQTNVTAASADELLIEDASDAANPKKVTAQSIADLSVSGVTVEDDGSTVVSGATAINAGTDLSVSDDGDGTVTVNANAPVDSVAGKTGAVTLTPADVSLGSVPNEDATDMANWDQKGATTGQVPTWNGSQYTPQDAGGGVEPHAWANINSDGSINSSSGISSVTQPFTGRYALNLNSAVSSLTNIVITGSGRRLGRYITHQESQSTTTSIWIGVMESDASQVDADFSVMIWDL